MPHTTTTLTSELSTRGLAGHALRKVQKLNATLRRTRELASDYGGDGQSLALLLAETRVLILRMGRREFGKAAGMDYHAVKNCETPGTHPQHESLSRVYRIWDQLASDKKVSPQVKKQLRAACHSLIDILVPEQDREGTDLRESVYGLYQVWMYQLGRDAFEAASRKANRGGVPLTYGALWQRRHGGMVPDFGEVRTIGTHLKRDIGEAVAIWSKEKTAQLLARGVPDPLARLTVAIQVKYPELRMTAASIAGLEVTEKTARAIKSGQLTDFESVRPAVRKVFPQKEIAELEAQWKSAWQRLELNECFATALPRICRENGWTNHMLANLLQVRPPEQRGRSHRRRPAKSRRKETYRPSAEIRRMYQENAFSGQAPAKAVIDLVARDNVVEGPASESQRDYLTRLFLEGVEQRLAHNGNAAQGSPLRCHRILCGVPPQELADASGYSKEDILLIERGRCQVGKSEERRLLKVINEFPAHKILRAREQLEELVSAPVTVSQAVTRLKDRHGGYIPLSRLVHDEHDRRLNISPVHLKRVERGDDVPTLPLLRHLVTRGGTEVSDKLREDWYAQFPDYLYQSNKLRWRHPLVRGFGMVIFEKWFSLKDFWEEQFQDDFSYAVITRNFQQLNGHGPNLPWTTVSRYLNAAGVALNDPRRLYLQRLFEYRAELTEAVTAEKHARISDILARILAQWRRETRSHKLDPKAVEHTLGLTSRERRSVKKRK